MRKTGILLLAVLLWAGLSFSASPAKADGQESFTSGGWTCVVTEDGTAEITGCARKAGEVEIPAELDGRKVTALGPKALFRGFDVTAVTIPDSVTRIEGNPFSWCKDLMEIRVSPEHPALAVTDGVLFGKTDRKLISMPMGPARTEYAVPEGTRMIGMNAFSSCAKLIRVTIPDSVTEIGDQAFSGCKGITEITIPSGVTVIGERAFYNTGLKEAVIPESVTDVGGNPFGACRELKRIVVPPEHPVLAMENGALFSRPDHRLVCCLMDSAKGEYAVPQGTRIIAPFAFVRCDGLTRVTIPEGVTEIGTQAFSACKGLTEAVIPGSVERIADNAFFKCKSLTVIAGKGSYAEQYCAGSGIRCRNP